MTDNVVYEPDSKMQKAAQNAWLQVAARVLMVVFSGLGMPIIILIGVGISNTLSSLRVGLHEVQLSIANTKSEVLNLKTLHEYQLRSFNDRLSAQSNRMDGFDRRFDRLENPFFNGSRPGPATP